MMCRTAPSTSSWVANLLLRIVMSEAPLPIVPPMPVIPSSVKPLAPELSVSVIFGVAPGAALIVTALSAPAHIP